MFPSLKVTTQIFSRRYQGHQTEDYPVRDRSVVVEICDRRKHHRRHVANVPLSMLEHYTPAVVELVELNPMDSSLVLSIRLRSYKRTANIDEKALRHLFSHWSGHLVYFSICRLLSCSSVSKEVLHYRALQLLLHPEAETLRERLMASMRTELLSVTDVQTIWHVFVNLPEWPDWLDAIMYNVAQFQFFKEQREGGLLDYVLETEMLSLDETKRRQVVKVFNQHRLIATLQRYGRPAGPLRRFVHHLCVAVW